MHFVDQLLNERIKSGHLLADGAQAKAAKKLTRLQKALVGYTNETILEWNKEKLEAQNNRNDEKMNNNETKEERETNTPNSKQVEQNSSFRIPRGLFLYGEVGTGKSMLMDTFFEQVPVNRKRRVHFHSFMQQVHKDIFDLKQDDLKKYGRNFHVDTSTNRNPIYRVAQQLSSDVQLLCFDEFQVTDVADALIMKQLFEVLFVNGTVVVATSNRPPWDLYEGGINRSYFMPFIDLLSRHCIVHEINSKTDYRRVNSQDWETYFLVDDPDFEASSNVVDGEFVRLLNGKEPTEVQVSVGFNRFFWVESADPEGKVARFAFDSLCNANIGSSDYRAIAKFCDVILLERIPHLTLKNHDQARRFITLVDELYEAKCALLCTAVASPDDLFLDQSGNHVLEQIEDSTETKVEEIFGIDVAQSNDKSAGAFASVKELPFAFRRASSRLTEMCSRRWWDAVLPNESKEI